MAFSSLRHTLAALLVLFSLATGAAAVQVRVMPSPSAGAVGSTIAVTVEADSVTGLGGFQFGFAYSTTDLQVVSATVNPAFDQVVKQDLGSATGKGMIAATVFNNPAQSGTPVTLATIDFRILTPVTGTITLSNVVLGQVGGTEIPSTAVGGTIVGNTPTYTVSYDGYGSTGGTVPADATAYLSGATVTVLGNTGNLVKTGYTFAGWNSAANGSGTSYAASSIFTMGSANVTLYAQWTAIPTYIVTFTSGGNGTLFGTTSQPVYSGASTSAVSAVPTTSYHFVNWTGTGGFVTTTANPLTVSNVTAAMTITANFAADPVNGVCGSSNGGTFIVAPATDLCSSGSATPVSGSGPWNWSCIGSNGGSSASCSAGIDITGPLLTVSTLADGAITNNATLNVSGTVSDTSGVAGLTINNATVTVTNGSFSYAVVLQPGPNTITTIAKDTLGNSTTDSRIITLDITAPILTITAPADNSKTAQGVTTVTGTINETSTVTVKVNSGSPQSASITGATFSTSVNLSLNLNTIDIAATDLAGNTSSVVRTVIYDNTTPSLAITSPGQDITTAQNSITIIGTVSDSITAVSVSITFNNQTFTPAISIGTFSQQINIPAEGSYVITATATDEAGNSSSVSRNIIYAIPGNGSCGTSNGAYFSVAPTSYLCSAGTAGTVTGTGPWNWTCSGTNGGTTVDCSANITTITASNQTINFGAAPGLTYGGSAGTVSATATSGLPVTFSSLTPTVCTISGSTVTPLSSGTCTIAANQSGNANYSAAAQVTQNISIAKATSVITWANPAAITYGTPLSAIQLNAIATSPGTFTYTPPSGTVLGAGIQTLSVIFTPTDTTNYTTHTASVSLTVNAAAPNQVITGTDGKTTVPVTITINGATVRIASGTLLTDANGNPISGALTVSAAVMNNISALPVGLATAQTSDGSTLLALGTAIDMTISAGTVQVKTIAPPMTVNLSMPSTFANSGATVSYYSFDGTIWRLEGTATVKPDGSADMLVGHLSTWAVATFKSAAASAVPDVTNFTVPMLSTSAAVSGITVTAAPATGASGITGYLLTENATAPLASDPSWSATPPTAYSFNNWGNHTLYAYAKDAAGNVSEPKTSNVYIGNNPAVDGVIVPASGGQAKLEPVLADALKALYFAMKLETPTATELLHGDVAPLVNGVPHPDGEINLGDTIVILRRVVGLW